MSKPTTTTRFKRTAALLSAIALLLTVFGSAAPASADNGPTIGPAENCKGKAKGHTKGKAKGKAKGHSKKACIASPSNLTCTIHFAATKFDGSRYEPQIIDFTWEDNSKNESDYIIRTSQFGVPAPLEKDYSLGPDATRLTFETNGDVVDRVVSIAIVGPGGVVEEFDDFSPIGVCDAAPVPPIAVVAGQSTGDLDVTWSDTPMADLATDQSAALYDEVQFGQPSTPIAVDPVGLGVNTSTFSGLNSGVEFWAAVETCYDLANTSDCWRMHPVTSAIAP